MVALLPWVAAVLLVAWQFVLVGEARSSAAIAARAGARAVAVGADPAVAARERLPRRLRRGLRVEAVGGGPCRSACACRRSPRRWTSAGSRRRPRWSGAVRSERGQATVELAALLPLLAVVALAAYAMLAGLSAGEQAGVAAEAGAIAVLQDRDAADAAREALPVGVRRADVSGSAAVGSRSPCARESRSSRGCCARG